MNSSQSRPTRDSVYALAGSLLIVVMIFAGAPVTAQKTESGAAETATPAAPQSLGQWFGQAARAWANEDYRGWVEAVEKLHRMRPFNYDFMQQLVMGYALTDQPSKAFDMMMRMQQQGLAADWDQIDEVESLRQHEVYDYLNSLMTEAAEPAGTHQTAFTVPASVPMPEALAHDSETGRTFVGTVRDGRILVHEGGDAPLRKFADAESVPGLMAVFDLLVDSERGHLWVATGSTGQYRNARAALFGRTALIKLDLKNGTKLGEYRVLPDGGAHLLGAMAMAADGTIYATDTVSPRIYRLRPGAERPKPFLGHSVFTSLRGLTLSAEEQRLYVADYELGIFFFNLDETREGFALGIPANLNLGGIDGLYHWNGHLVAVQNGVTPQRVLRLKLDESGTRVAEVATLIKGLDGFDNPTYGTLDGDDLLLLARSHWHLVNDGGRPIDPPLPDVPVLRTPIPEAANVVAGQEILDQILKQRSGSGPLRNPDR